MGILRVVGSILSPTFTIIDNYKDEKGVDKDVTLTNWSCYWLWVQSGTFVVLCLISFHIPTRPTSECSLLVTYLILWAIPFSRCNEITYVFYRDCMQKLGKSTNSSSHNPENVSSDFPKPWVPHERIQSLIRSYAELALNFALIYYFLPTCMFKHALQSPLQALYFSGVTITTLGYGDIKPMHDLSRSLAVYEVLSGILLVVLALATYISVDQVNGRTRPS